MTDGPSKELVPARPTVLKAGAKPDAKADDRWSRWKQDRRRSMDARFGAFRDRARDSRWAVVIVATLVVALSGAGVVAAGGLFAEPEKTVQAQTAEAPKDPAVTALEKRIAELDANRAEKEKALAELDRKAAARRDEISDGEKQVAALNKRRDTLQAQVAELVAPVSPGVDDPQAAARAAEAAAEPADESRDVADQPREDEAIAQGAADRLSSASVDHETPDAVSTRSQVASIDPAEASGPTIPTRVFIHILAGDPAATDRARAVAAELRRRGVEVAEIRGVRLPVRRDAVRYFHDADRGAAAIAQEAVRRVSPSAADPVAQDFRAFRAAPRAGVIELWLS